MLSQTIKGKYEAILGFVTLVISISAFKDELAKVIIDLGFLKFTLAAYFLLIIYGFCLCLYLYIMEYMVRDFAFGNLKIFDYLTRVGFFLFVLILCSPLILLLFIFLHQIYLWLSLDLLKEFGLAFLGNLAASLSVLLATGQLAEKLYRRLQQNKKEQVEEEEIIALDTAAKLLKDGYYSQSLLETFKALNYHLYKRLLELQIRISSNRFDEIIRLAIQHGFVDAADSGLIADIRGARNAAAHTNTGVTEQLANSALNYVRNLIDNAS